jgi:hypothetical protein
MNIENLFKNEEQLARDARGTAEFLAADKMFDDISEEHEFKAGCTGRFPRRHQVRNRHHRQPSGNPYGGKLH